MTGLSVYNKNWGAGGEAPCRGLGVSPKIFSPLCSPPQEVSYEVDVKLSQANLKGCWRNNVDNR